jgi:DNA gyrase/topoisomerase IV subunit A
MEIAANGAAYRRCPERVAELKEQIGDLQSVRERLMHRRRTLNEDHIEYVSQTRVKLAGLRAEMQKEREEFRKLAADVRLIISSDSEVRASIFREMIELAQTSPYARRYSDTLYQMAVMVLFRSRSSYDFMHWFLPITVPGSVYHHFRE